jgi:ferredoxin-NADP reductase
MASNTLQVFVHTLRYEAEGIISIELRAPDQKDLPVFEAGSHIDVHLPNGMVRSYSLLNDSSERHRYVLGVLKDAKSRGGSKAVHEQLRVGMRIEISPPRNNFALHENATHSVLVAGGIGVTPILCMARRLKSLGQSFEVLYFARTRQHAAFLDDVKTVAANVHLHFDNERSGPPDLKALLAARNTANAHYYACGPAVMLDAFETHCQALGYANAHIERFAAVEVAASSNAKQSYTVELKRSGKVIEITPDMSLLAALQTANADIMTSCEEGICGSCETRVLEGIPDHRDSVLSPAEQATNQMMMVCVSGCQSERLVLDC